MGTLAVVTLVALRLGIGWHFFREGTDKILVPAWDPPWTSAHFFTGSRGPLHPYFELLVWDVDGKARLNYERTESGWPVINVERTRAAWDQYRARVADHYGFDEPQQEQAAACLKRFDEELTWYFDANREEILQYFHGLDRRGVNAADEAKQEVPALWGQAEKIEAELTSARMPWLGQVAQVWSRYDDALNAIATSEQSARGRLTIGKPEPGWLNTNFIDRFVPWFDLAVGVLLIFGLCTRLAALAGAGFLFSIILTQWPGAMGALPTYYQTIEMLGMLVLAAVAAGQFAGLDFIVYSYWSRLTQSKQGKIS